MKIVSVSILLCLFCKDAELKTFNPSSSSALQSAIDDASPGDVISLDVKDYKGDFTLKNSGNNGNPITIIGKSENNKNTCIIGSGTAFDIQANYWVIQGMEIKDGDHAIEINGNHNLIKALAVHGVKKAIVVKGSANIIRDCAIGSGGNAVAFEKGDGNQLVSNAISTKNPNLNILGNTCCGSVESNTFQGPVVIKGNKYIISSNVAKGGINLEGCNNELSSNVFMNVFFTKSCRNNDAGMNIYQGMVDQVQPFNMEIVGSDSGASGNQITVSLAIFTNVLFFIYSNTVLYI